MIGNNDVIKRIDMKATGLEINRRMLAKGITVSELANILYITPTSVYNWLKGERLPKIDNLVTIADIFDCKIDDLIKEQK